VDCFLRATEQKMSLGEIEKQLRDQYTQAGVKVVR
jgi:hypothetical protein